MIYTANPILNRVLDGERLSASDAIKLMEEADLLDLAYAAKTIQRKLHPKSEPITYCVQRNINYSNVCTAKCTFCAFYTFPGVEQQHNPAYVNDYETVIKPKIDELIAIGGTEILFQGGHNPDLGLDYYTDLFSRIKKDFPEITCHALSPSEINHIAEKMITPAEKYGDGTNLKNIDVPSEADLRYVLQELKKSGMDSLPGAGAEILTERVRKIIAPYKITTERWLKIMEIAHNLGMRASATMMYGHVETYEDRIQHLAELRELQDRTNGFTAFVLWNFQRGGTPLGKIMDSMQARAELPEYNINSSGEDYLRSLAVARLFLDNFENFQASWVTQGHEIGQLSLNFGCNDLGGTMMEENVVSAANTSYQSSVAYMEYLIKKAGYQPAQRDTQYNLVEAS